MFTGHYINGAGEREEAVNSVIVESPTGSGKTIMGLTMAKVLQSEHKDMVIGWVAMRRNLLSQVTRENVNKKLHVQDFHATSMFERRPEALLQARRDGRKIMLVIDEAQHDAASSCAHLHNLIKPDYVLGLTATPFRTDRMKLCFTKTIKDAGIHQLIQDGYLSKYHHYSVPRWTPEVVCDFYCANPARWGKSIFYFWSLEECWELKRRFDEAGVLSDVVHGASRPDHREEQLAAFREGAVPCLINCMVLTEGFDEPSLQTAWVRDSGKGPTMQMAGRVFRQFAGMPHKIVVQSKMTRWPMMRTALPEQQYLWQQDQWLTLKVNPKLNLINQNARLAIAGADVEMPKYILARRDKRPNRIRF
jgi:superfamily II DNA or RNA helicase